MRRISAMLDLPEPPCKAGDPIPLGWHFPLLGANTPRSRLRADGFAGLGIELPDIRLPRLVATGRRVEVRQPLRVGEALERESTVTSVVEKQASAGNIAVFTADHEIRTAGSQHRSIAEQQTYVFLSGRYREQDRSPWQPSSDARVLGKFVPDDMLLFQFSSLSFNAHRIHLDRDYAREAEGYPDLVVNGGITTLLMTEHARSEFGILAGTFTVSNKAPLFVNREIAFWTERTATGLRIVALDDNGLLAAEMDILTDAI